MQQPGQAVTPDGVRRGEPGALAALCERRGAAVLAYTREVCDAEGARHAAAEALARFRAAVWASGDAADLDPERLLLSATRHAAAACAQPPESGATRRILGRSHTDTCQRMPVLIVARAENLLGPADLDRLSRHLERCASCRATEAAFRRAERAYVASTHAPVDSATAALFLGALAEAAPIDAPVEPVEPAPAAPEPAAVEPAAPEPEVVQEAEPAVVATPEPEPEPEPQVVAAPEPERAPEPQVIAAAEPEPVHEALPDDLDDHDEDGWTDPVEDTYDHHMIEPGPATWNAPDEPAPRRRRTRIVLPIAVLVAGAVAAMGVAGVFDGGGSSSGTTSSTAGSTTAAPATTTAAKHAKRHRRATTSSTVTATP
jgi:hypothetical protein